MSDDTTRTVYDHFTTLLQHAKQVQERLNVPLEDILVSLLDVSQIDLLTKVATVVTKKTTPDTINEVKNTCNKRKEHVYNLGILFSLLS